MEQSENNPNPIAGEPASPCRCENFTPRLECLCCGDSLTLVVTPTVNATPEPALMEALDVVSRLIDLHNFPDNWVYDEASYSDELSTLQEKLAQALSSVRQEATLAAREVAAEHAFLTISDLPHGDPWTAWMPTEYDHETGVSGEQSHLDALEAAAAIADELEDPYAGDSEGEMKAEAEAERQADAAHELACELANEDWSGWY